jgi:hypothetical protein
MEFCLPKSSLPDSKIHRRMLLDEYFPQGVVPFESLTEEGWKVVCFSPKDPAYFVDPNIANALDTWPEAISLELIETYYRVYKNAYISMCDSWSLHYWTLFLDWLKRKGEGLEQVCIIHIDDHLDQASPLIISLEEGAFECLFSKKKVSIDKPSTICEAIQNKSIDIGSFFVPFLHALQSVQILHLRYAYHGAAKEHGLICNVEKDTLLAPGKLRPALSKTTLGASHSYTIASSTPPLVEKIGHSPYILLHVDCDAFNNRYNGNSLWYQQPPSIDLNIKQIQEKIDDLFTHITGFSNRIFMNIALSPGFFPSEFWKPTLQYLLNKAEESGIIREDEFSGYLKSECSKEVMHEFN